MKYNSNVKLGKVVLNVVDLEMETKFYKEILGFNLLNSTDEFSEFSVTGNDEIFLKLEKINADINSKSFGLYHMAILLPSRQALADLYRYLLENGMRFVGAADHGYSEAIYFEDFENNGIEIYRDKPLDKWDIRENGDIIGVTKVLDLNSLYNEGNIYNNYKIAEGTVMGHIHLSVENAKESSKIYQEILNMNEKMGIPSASWISSGNYHHHLAFNQWEKNFFKKRDENNIGLKYFEIIVIKREIFETIKRNASKSFEKFKKIIIEENLINLTDNDGINLRVKLES